MHRYDIALAQNLPQRRDKMLTLRRISSTVATVRLDTKWCSMFAVTGHGWFHVEQRFHMVQWRIAARRLGGRGAGAGPWLAPVAGR